MPRTLVRGVCEDGAPAARPAPCLADRPEEMQINNEAAVPGLLEAGSRRVSAREIEAVARLLVRKYGAATIQEVASNLDGIGASPGNVAAVLRFSAGFRWLDRDSGWFWLGDAFPNKLSTLVRKVFCVTTSISLGELRDAVARVYPTDRLAPPLAVVGAACDQMEGIAIDGDTVRVSEPLPAEMHLTEIERFALELFRREGGCLAIADFTRHWDEAGLSRFQLNGFVLGSPIMTRLAHGVYALAGAEVGPASVQAKAGRAARKGVVRDVEIGESRISMELVVTTRMWRTGLVALPASCAPHLSGSYTVAVNEPNGPRILVQENGAFCTLNVTPTKTVTRLFHLLEPTGTRIGERIRLTWMINHHLVLFDRL